MSKHKQIIFVTMLFIIGAMSACDSMRNSSGNNKSASGNERQKSTTAANKQENTKSMNSSDSEESAQTKLVEIYDGREASRTKKLLLSKAEREVVEKEVRGKESEIKKKHPSECVNNDFSVDSGIKGSFTKPNLSETAYFYSLCTDGSTSSPIGVGGIVIFEAAKMTALYTFQTVGFTEIKSLPDINKNGLSEIAIITENGGQGARATNLMLLEYEPSDLLNYLGSTKVGSVSLSTTPPMETTSVISVEPSANPTFFYDLYAKEDGAKDWSPNRKGEKLTLMPEAKNSTVFIKVD